MIGWLFWGTARTCRRVGKYPSPSFPQRRNPTVELWIVIVVTGIIIAYIALSPYLWNWTSVVVLLGLWSVIVFAALSERHKYLATTRRVEPPPEDRGPPRPQAYWSDRR